MRSFLIVSLALAGCATVPPATYTAPGDAGASVDRYLAANLRDPASAQQYEVGIAHQCNVGILGGKWCACWQVNSKNAFGGHVGPTRFLGWFDPAGTAIVGAMQAEPMGTGAHCLSATLTPRDPALLRP